MAVNERIALGENGWFNALLDEAAAAAPAQATKFAGGDEFDRSLVEKLRASGILAGKPFQGVPGPVRGRTEDDAALVERLRLGLAAVAELALPGSDVAGDRRRGRLRLAALVGGFAGEQATAERLLAESRLEQPTLDDFGEKRLVGIVGARLLRRGHRFENAAGALTMRPALAFLDLRWMVKFAAAQVERGGSLSERSARRLAALSKARALVAEALVALASTDGAPSAELMRLVRRQVRSVVLIPADRRATVRAIERPRPVAEVLGQVPAVLREALAEQLVASALRQGLWGLRMRAALAREAAAAGLGAPELEAATARAEAEASSVLVHLPGPERPVAEAADTDEGVEYALDEAEPNTTQAA